MTQLIIARKALGPSFAPGGGLEVLPGLLTGLFSPFAVGFRDVAQPHPTLSFCVGPTRPGITPAAPWHQFWGFFLAISSLKRGGRDARPGSLSITWIMTGGSLSPTKKWDIPILGGPVGPHTVPARAHPLPRLPGSCQLCSQWIKDLLGFSPCSHGLVGALWGTFGFWGDDNWGCFMVLETRSRQS